VTANKYIGHRLVYRVASQYLFEVTGFDIRLAGSRRPGKPPSPSNS
jgi:hypothetical protein